MLLVVSAVLLVAGLVLVAVSLADLSNGPGIIRATNEEGGTLLLVVVRASTIAGAVLTWPATVVGAAARAARRASRSAGAARGPVRALAVAAALVVVGVLLVVAYPESDEAYYFAVYGPLDAGSGGPRLVALPPTTIIGSLLAWAGALLAAAVLGRRTHGHR